MSEPAAGLTILACVRPSLSVVIPAHNAEDTLADQLEALCAQGYDGTWEVIVVDNNSTDRTDALARSYGDQLPLRILAAREQSSVAYARNAGIAVATGDLLVFLDADDVAAPGLLEAYARGSEWFDVMGGYLDDFTLNDEATALWRYRIAEESLPRAFGRFSFFVGANFAVRKTVFDELGTFDERLPYVGEDVDFSIRAQLAGHEIGWIPDAVVRYRHRSSLKALARQQFTYGRGSVWLYERYRGIAGPGPRAAALRRFAEIVVRLPNLARGRSRRGRWIMLASSTAGQVAESVRRGVWYVG
jgi:glycosyltransferase involved in cell wall biosynthesis